MSSWKKEKKLSNTHAVLHRKLEELESLLTDGVFLQSSDTANLNIVCKEVKQKFIFFKNLLAAEINSDEANPHHHLQHIAERLIKLEHDYFSLFSSSGNSCIDYIDNDSTSTCSCTESCFHDHEEKLGDGGLLTREDAEMFAEGFEREKAVVKVNGQKGLVVKDRNGKENLVERPDNIYHSFKGGNPMVNFEVGVVKQKGYVKEEKNKTRIVHKRDGGDTGIGWLFSGIFFGVGLGMVFMGMVMAKFSGCLCIVDQTSFPTPT